ncbi:hypothetical protein ACED98_11495, partial [Streptococcus thoraltensis]
GPWEGEKRRGSPSVSLDGDPKTQRFTSLKVVHVSNHASLAVMMLDAFNPVSVPFAMPKNFLTKDL